LATYCKPEIGSGETYTRLDSKAAMSSFIIASEVTGFCWNGTIILENICRLFLLRLNASPVLIGSESLFLQKKSQDVSNSKGFVKAIW
jgi:hypothetical protein